MPYPGPLPTPRDNQRLTLRFLHAPLDVEHDGDVVTLYDSAKRHPGMSNRSMLWMAGLFLLLGVPSALIIILARPGPPFPTPMIAASAALLLAIAGYFFVMARLPNERLLAIDLHTGSVDLRWMDAELARWTGDVDGLRLYVCPMRPMGSILLSPCFATVAVLEGTRTPPDQIEFERGPLTRAMLHLHVLMTARNVNRHHTDQGWILLATGDDPDALEAELREALPTLTRVIEPQRIDDPLTGPVDARLLRKATPRSHGAS